MKLICTLLLACCSLLTFGQTKDTRYFELRIYYAASGKLDALIQRFQNHTTKLFEKHGMENIGYWVPVENKDNSLYYILAYPSKESRDKSWADFSADPTWKEVVAKSQANGKLVDSVKSVFMNYNDILPMINYKSSGADRVFELRTYYCNPGKLPNLVARFTNHTVKLFEKHGMDNIVYFTTAEKDGAQPKLVYLVAHKNMDAATKSWADFVADPVWIAARDASEKDGKILEKLERIYVKPLPFSKLK